MILSKVIKIIIALAALVLVIFITLSRYISEVEWEYISSNISPNGKYGVYLYNYQSDGDEHAPYGQYLFFKPEYRIANPLEGNVIFAGYCGVGLSYSWVSDMEIRIICPNLKEEDVRTVSNKIFGIHVKLLAQ